MKILIDLVLPVLAVLVLVAIVGFFAASETAFLSITKVTLKQMLKEDEKSGKKNSSRKVAALKKDMNRLLSLILIGINFITSLASGLAATIAINLLGDAGSAYATAIMVFVLIIFGEITPKTVAAVFPVQTARKFAGPLLLLQKAFFPIVWIFAKISGFLTVVLNSLWKDEKEIVTEEELKSLINVGVNEGTLENTEKEILYKIFDFTDLCVRDIMRHKSFVKYVSATASYETVIKTFIETGYSRILVCGPDQNETTDCSFDNVEGVIYYKNALIRNSRNKKNEEFARKCMSKVYFVPESISATEILQKFKKEKISFAVAVDENGCNTGIVTMDDILRAVFGRSVNPLNDEIPPEKRIKALTPKEYIVPGDIKLSDLNDFLYLDLESENYDTIAGWLLEKFDKLPEAGEVYRNGDVVFEVMEQSQRRIQSLKVLFRYAPK